MDRTTKILLALIASGLWANAVAPVIHTARAQYDSSYLLRSISSDVSSIKSDLDGISSGLCLNSRLCR
jgi:hypothetical protein